MKKRWRTRKKSASSILEQRRSSLTSRRGRRQSSSVIPIDPRLERPGIISGPINTSTVVNLQKKIKTNVKGGTRNNILITKETSTTARCCAVAGGNPLKLICGCAESTPADSAVVHTIKIVKNKLIKKDKLYNCVNLRQLSTLT